MLWSKEDSLFQQEKKFFDDHFGAFYRVASVIILAKNEGEDLVKREVLEELYDFHQQILNLRVQFEGSEIGYTDVCAHLYDTSPCILQTVLDYWLPRGAETFANWNLTEIQTSTPTELHDRVSGTPYPSF